MTAIVAVNVYSQVAPAPATLQQTGAMISQGGTITAPGTVSQLTQLSDLTPLYTGASAIASLAWASGVATVTTAAPHGLTLNEAEPVLVTIAGVTTTNAAPSAYNGQYGVTATGASTFTYPLAANPGTVVSPGVWTLYDVTELCAMATSYFGQGGGQSVYVLEFGEGDPADGVAQLSAYIAANVTAAQPLPGSGTLPSRFYSYLVPREWDQEPTFLTLLQSYQNPSSEVYFFTTTTLATRSRYTNLNKCVVDMVEAPTFGIWKSNTLTALSWANTADGEPVAGEATGTTTTAHGVQVGQWFQIAGAVPVAYNGYWQALPGTTGSTLVWALPGTTPGTATAFGTLVPSYTSNTGVAPNTEFSAAAMFQHALAYNPGATNRVTPFAFSFLYGVTPFPTRGLSALLASLKQGADNYVDTGAEGGISNAILKWGTTKDGNDFTYWYATDWMHINIQIDLANAVINGSNNPLNPLYYDQNGINTLSGVAANRANIGVTFGLVLGTAVQTSLDGPALDAALNSGMYAGQTVVNAVPFITYSNENPGHYGQGIYNGLSVTFVPKRGFTSITVNLTVSNFVTTA